MIVPSGRGPALERRAAGETRGSSRRILWRVARDTEQVVRDEAVQRTGGDALWNTMQYALKTPLMRIVGLGLIAYSAALVSGRVGGSGGGNS